MLPPDSVFDIPDMKQRVMSFMGGLPESQGLTPQKSMPGDVVGEARHRSM